MYVLYHLVSVIITSKVSYKFVKATNNYILIVDGAVSKPYIEGRLSATAKMFCTNYKSEL